jgi:hypothetical protein
MKNKEDLYFKFNKTNEETYIQIWKRVKGEKDLFLMSCGSARKLYNKLVRLAELEEQTKNLEEFKTKILRVNQDKTDQ